MIFSLPGNFYCLQIMHLIVVGRFETNMYFWILVLSILLCSSESSTSSDSEDEPMMLRRCRTASFLIFLDGSFYLRGSFMISRTVYMIAQFS
jgi:hypothetical protein